MQHCFNSLRAIVSVLAGIARQHMCEIVYCICERTGNAKMLTNTIFRLMPWKYRWNEKRKQTPKKKMKENRNERKSQIDTINGSRHKNTIYYFGFIGFAEGGSEYLFLICRFFHRKWLRNQLSTENFIIDWGVWKLLFNLNENLSRERIMVIMKFSTKLIEIEFILDLLKFNHQK